MDKKLIASISIIVLAVIPLMASAASLVPLPGIIQDVNSIWGTIFGIIWPFFAAFAVIMFLVSGFLFLSAQGDPGKVAGARMAVIWGMVGVAVGLLAFSIPWIIKNGLGV